MTRQIISRFQTEDGQNLSVSMLDGMIEISRFRFDDDGKFEPKGRVVIAGEDLDRLIDGLQRARPVRGADTPSTPQAEGARPPAGVIEAADFAAAVHHDIASADKPAKAAPAPGAQPQQGQGLFPYIASGLIQPGCELEIVDRKGCHVQGVLAADGTLAFDGKSFRTPVAAWRFFCRNKALNVAEPDPMTIIRYRHQGTQRLRILADLEEQTRADARASSIASQADR